MICYVEGSDYPIDCASLPNFGKHLCIEEFSDALSGWDAGLCGYCANHCEMHAGLKEDLGDGVCKEECNSRVCEYDAGDCVGPM